MNSGEFNVIITITDDDIISVNRIATLEGDPNLTEEFYLQLPDPGLFKKLRKILCP